MEIVQEIKSGYTYLAEIRGYNCLKFYLIKQTGYDFWLAMDITTYETDVNGAASIMCSTNSMFETLENIAINDELGFLTLHRVDSHMEMRKAMAAIQMIGEADIEKLNDVINSISLLGKDLGGLNSDFTS